jgi:predicted CXXCH cytochrome family protein
MKLVRITFALVVALGFGRAYAFHSGGVAECEGCHSMHSPAAGGYALLVGTDASSTCLSCHEQAGLATPSSYHVSTASADMPNATSTPIQRTPGGDFGWLKKTYTWSGGSEEGYKHGHNVVAVDQGYAADPVNTLAPGGSFVGSQLACISCHDPHGQGRRTGTDAAPTFAFPAVGTNVGPIMASGSYTNSPAPTTTGEAVGIYRILASPGYTRAQGVTWGGFPVAIAPSTYNRTEAASDTRVAYGGTGTNSWGDWCGSCHPAMHQDGGAGAYVHPTERALGGIATLYNAYVKSGDLTGSAATAYSSLVPFAENTTDFSVLKAHATPGFTAGPSTADRVACMSCHRAHASAFPEMLRWQPAYEFITKFSIGSAGATLPAGTVGYTAIDVTGTAGRGPTQANGRQVQAEYIAAYYDRPVTKFASHQRVLCNKCHAKD